MDLQAILDDIGQSIAQNIDRGAVATYIAKRAAIDPAQFGIATAFPSGEVVRRDNDQIPF